MLIATDTKRVPIIENSKDAIMTKQAIVTKIQSKKKWIYLLSFLAGSVMFGIKWLISYVSLAHEEVQTTDLL